MHHGINLRSEFAQSYAPPQVPGLDKKALKSWAGAQQQRGAGALSVPHGDDASADLLYNLLRSESERSEQKQR